METDSVFQHRYLLHIVYSLVYVLHNVFCYSVCDVYSARWPCFWWSDSSTSIAQLDQYTVSQKKGATQTMAITLSILDRFAKFFHYCKDQ